MLLAPEDLERMGDRDWDDLADEINGAVARAREAAGLPPLED